MPVLARGKWANHMKLLQTYLHLSVVGADFLCPTTTHIHFAHNNTTPLSTPPSPQPQHTRSAGKGKGSCIQRLLSILNLLLCAGMITLGILTLIGFNKTMDISEAFVAAYMILFAALLALYEFMWWSTIDSINKSMRKNFGFLYGIKGKAFYLIFIAFLTIGLEVSIRWLRYTVGIAFLADGALHLFLLCSKPDLVSSYSAPSGGLSESGDAVV